MDSPVKPGNDKVEFGMTMMCLARQKCVCHDRNAFAMTAMRLSSSGLTRGSITQTHQPFLATKVRMS